ncbi:MAG TPA: trehalose-6-phosphate synthase [Acidiphilium sp.]|jgi:trehalose 6-phosphate synthase|uniref:alpha,alpha-trehalose-phosphate synthase (UDP-forming) n=1 Tax=unclassified Acidiphilium TaxID=2617493 RepID=UPI000BC5455A|nr:MULTISPECIES: trehalose-6-phosphate synthase [unclassified Acidiphilium]OYV57339.1 MAG: trehalose-6-phosphate synthase [Acidiphilium sp. 20-67-58]HQT60477.1 trehalose-6-phosphate synthase [Acidiphilium sp.]HQU10447.1 trehalose-6-phosphate synthase [Acidiphilium sp.]
MGRLVVVSNRVSLPTDKGAKAGGLAVALEEAMIPGSLWFGWSGRRSASDAGRTAIAEHRGITYATLDLSEAEYRRFYVGFSNGALWPLLHYRSGLFDFRRDEFEGYLAVNERFAARLAPLLDPDDVIWIHDYQLLTMAEALRRRGVTNRIGLFLHIPFVPPAMLHVLPEACQLVRAMAAADLVGFQTEGDRANFLECAASCMELHRDGAGGFVHDGHRTMTTVTPVGIDAEGFARAAQRAAGMADSRRLVSSLVGRALAIGVDRLDYTKGLPQRFDAFGRLFQRHPEHLRRISLLQIAARSREDVDRYQALRHELDRQAGKINGAYSDFDWTPLRYMTRAVNRATIAGFYRIASIGLVTPLRDGMNLVAKEFIAAQDPADPGVLVLSRFAGAAEELTEALIVNPYDADQVADAMHAALLMPAEERVARHAALLGKIRARTAASFCRSFLDQLREIER